MKSAALFLTFSWALCAQAVPSATVSPEIPDEEVIAIFDDGGKLTMREFRAVFIGLDQQSQRSAMTNRAAWIHQFGLMRKLAGMAEREKLDQASPAREVLQYQRMATLSLFALNAQANATPVEGEQITRTYETTKDKYKQVKVRVIYISFLSESLLKSGSKGLSEPQAKAKAEKLVQQIRQGADFVQLVKANSDDPDSREKGGEFSTMRRSDNIPEAIATAVFALKQGEISDPVRQPNGYYIFKADEVAVRPLSEVRDEIYSDLKMAAHQKWMKAIDESVKVKMVSEKFFQPQSAPVPPVGAPPKSAGK